MMGTPYFALCYGQTAGIICCVFSVFAVYSPENRAQCARIATRDGEKRGGQFQGQGTPMDREPASWSSETGRLAARGAAGAGPWHGRQR